VGNTVAAAVANTRVLESVEANIALIAGGTLAAIAALAFTYPQVTAYPIGILAAWLAAAILYRAMRLYRNRRKLAHARPARRLRSADEPVSTAEQDRSTASK